MIYIYIYIKILYSNNAPNYIISSNTWIMSTFINRTFLHKTTGVWLSGTDRSPEEALATVTCHHTIVFTSRTIATYHAHSLSQVHCPVITDNNNQHLPPSKRRVTETIANARQTWIVNNDKIVKYSELLKMIHKTHKAIIARKWHCGK